MDHQDMLALIFEEAEIETFITPNTISITVGDSYVTFTFADDGELSEITMETDDD